MRRFLLYWFLDYALAATVVYVISSASKEVFDAPVLSRLVLVFIPLSTLLFSWLFYRAVDGFHAHRLAVASIWVGLAMVVDGGIFWFIAHQSPLTHLFTSLALAVYGAKFLSVFLGAYLGIKTRAAISATDMLSPR